MSEENSEFFTDADLPPEVREALHRWAAENQIGGGDDPNAPMMISPDQIPPFIREGIEKMLATKMAGEILSKETKHSGHEPELTKKIQASEVQRMIGPGDRCTYTSGLEQIEVPGITLIEVQDPSAYAGSFPDWEEQLYNGYVLGKYWSTHEHEEENLGWFSRIGLIPLPEDWMWDEYWKYMLDGTLPADPPEWLVQTTIAMIQGVSEANNKMMPSPAHCINCGSTTVLLVTEETSVGKYYVGHLDHKNSDEDPATVYHTYAHHGIQLERKARVHCLACEFVDDIRDRGASLFIRDQAADVYLKD